MYIWIFFVTLPPFVVCVHARIDIDHKIWESSDSEFLSFLYAERDREYSKYSAWGVNLWVVAAAIIGLLGYAYNCIADDYAHFDWHLVLYYSTSIGAILIPLSKLFNPDLFHLSWRNKYRVTSVSMNAPIAEMFGKVMIIFVSLRFLAMVNEFGLVFWLWGTLLALESIPWIYMFVNGEKLIKVYRSGCIFRSGKAEALYMIGEVLLCLSILFAALCSWGGQYVFGAREFEMSCVLAIIYATCWLVFCHALENKHRFIDRWIEQYVYGILTKKELYFRLLEYTQGNDIIDIIRTEYFKVKPFAKEIAEACEQNKLYLQQITDRTLSEEEAFSYAEEMHKMLKRAIDNPNLFRDLLFL